jgi:ryanodine receptor 2
MNYIPNPIDTSKIEISQDILELVEKLAENTHDIWAKQRMSQGWTYGERRDDVKKTTPCLVSYNELPDSEKEYDRNTALETIKVMLSLGYEIIQK